MAALSAAVSCVKGTLPIVLDGQLNKKSKYMGAWRPRIFNLHTDKRMRYFDVHGKPLGIVVLKEGSIVRVLNDGEENTKLQIRDATGKIFNLEAANTATRDTWVHLIQRCIYGDMEDPNALVELEAGSWLDVVVPPSPPPGGGTLALPLWDGRTVPVAVPAGAEPGTFLRVRVPAQSSTLDVNREAETACVVNHLEPKMVPLAVPSVHKPEEPWGAMSQNIRASEAAEIAASQPKGPASERYDFDSDTQEETEPGQVFSTGKYNMKMLTRLTQMEGEFRAELATVWGVNDEDELPDSLQELDFNDILASGGTEAVRTAWLINQVTSAEDYNPDETQAAVSTLVEKTIRSIQLLEKEYAAA
jgi:hypothetical protein